MKGAKAIGVARLFWSLVLGLCLTLVLLCAMMARPTIEAQTVTPGFTVDLDHDVIPAPPSPRDERIIANLAMSGDRRVPPGSLPDLSVGRGPSAFAPASTRMLAGQAHCQSLSYGATLRTSDRTYDARAVRYFGYGVNWGDADRQAPDLILHVDYHGEHVYGMDYKPGHTVWITVTDSGGTIKATTTISTMPEIWPGGPTGFTVQGDEWLSGQPDIVPGDWVYGLMDNGQATQVQIGEITGTVDEDDDSVSGRIYAPWFTQTLDVDCHPWAGGRDAPAKQSKAGPNGDPPYYCQWDSATEWDMQPGHEVGVWYIGPDGNWVGTGFQDLVDLWVEKFLDVSLPVAGEMIAYQLHYGNNGNRAAHNVFLTDTLPRDTIFVAATFEGGNGLAEYVSDGVVVWDIGTLDPDESRQFELTVQIDGGTAPGTLLSNEAIISGDGEVNHLDNRSWHTTFVEPLAADLWVDEEVEGDLPSTENEINYRIIYRNDGTLAAQDVVLTDTLPVSMTSLWYSAGSIATMADGVIVWELGTVPPDGGGELLVSAQVSGTVPDGMVFTSTVEVSTGTPELDYDNNLAVVSLGPPQVICVPWAGTRPHRVRSGTTTTLKGTAKGHGLTTFEWNPGDGSSVVAGTVSDPYAIEAPHAYSAPPGTVYTATLTVWGAFGSSGTDTYTVKVFTPTHDVEVDMAVDEGLWYIHRTAQRYTSSGLPFAEWQTGGHGVAETASAVQAFQLQGHRPGDDPCEDPYVEDVQRGWNTLFTYSKLDGITVQPAGDPDSDGDRVGIGLYDDYDHTTYESGLAMMALATTGSPTRVVRTGPPIYVRGQTYYSITQDMADWFAWGQNDDGSGTARGGWRYRPNSGDSDNSNTQFPVLGLAAAEDNWGITVPTWVKDELRDYWLAYTQDSSGGFGYTDPGDWNNVGKAGAGIMDLIWTGVPVTDTRITSAARFIKEHWNDEPDGDWNGNLGELYAMYAAKKGSQFANIDWYGTHDWDKEYSSYLMGVQWPDGSFEGAGNMAGWQPMNTSWAVMILSPGLYRALPVPIFTVEKHSGAAWREVLFDASASHHTDPDREIVLFDWDFGDGTPVMTVPSSSITHTYPTQGTYLARLTVWDDAGNSATRDTEVNITAPEYHPPVADPGGPYSGRIGQEIVLDGSGSYDPDGGMDDSVVLYEWDVADGRLYTTTEPTLAHSWTVSGTFAAALRVQDQGIDDGFDLPKWSEPAITTVTISEEVPPPAPDGDGVNWLIVVVVAASLTIIAAVLSVVYRRVSR